MPALAGVGSKVHWQLREIYEFWGYDWLMPLWDLGLTEFLSRFPLKHYLNRRLYKEYVRRLCNLLGFPLKTPEPPKSSLKTSLKTAERFCNSFLPPFALQGIWKLRRKKDCKKRKGKDSLAFFGMIDGKYRKGYYFGINSFLSKRFIEKLEAGVYESVKTRKADATNSKRGENC